MEQPRMEHQMILENQILENQIQNMQSVVQPTTEPSTTQNNPILQISANQLNATYHQQKSTKTRFIAKQNSVPNKPSIRQTSQTVANCTNNNIDNEWEDIETHQNDDVFTEKTHQQNFLLNSVGRRKSSHSSAGKNMNRRQSIAARQLENLTGATKIMYQEGSGSMIPLSPNATRRSLTQTFRQRSVSSDFCTSGSASLPPSRHNSGKLRNNPDSSGRNSVNDMCINVSEDRINEERVEESRTKSVESELSQKSTNQKV